MSKQSKLFFLGILICILALFAACGQEAYQQSGKDDFVYLAEEIALPQGTICNYKTDGSYLYCHDVLSGTICRQSIDDISENRKVVVRKPSGNQSIIDYAVDSEQGIYYILQDHIMTDDYSTKATDAFLVKQASDGREEYRIALADVSRVLMGKGSGIAVNAEKTVFVLGEDGIYLFDAEGKPVGQFSTQGHKPEGKYGLERLLQGTEGKVYYNVIKNRTLPGSMNSVYEVVMDGKWQLKMTEAFSGQENGTLFATSYGMCKLIFDELYQYKNDEFILLLSLGDSGLTSRVSELVQINEDKWAVYYEYEGMSMDEQALYLLTRTPADQIPEKEVVVLATAYLDSSLEENVVKFNRSNDLYHVKIKMYEGEEWKARLDSSLVSSDPPDLLDLTGLDIENYVNKRLLEDLSPYIENSAVLDKGNFLDNIIEGYTLDGRLICIPSSFEFMAVIGRPSQIGYELGLSMEEVLTLKESYPEYRLMNQNNFEYMLYYILDQYIYERFIDWGDGSCEFNSDEFLNLIEWVRSLNDRIELGYVEEEDYLDGAVPGDMLLIRDRLVSLSSYVRYEMFFGDEVNIVGFPMPDGQPWYDIRPRDLLGIVAGSGSKDGAWSFIEYLLSKKETKSSSASGFPSRKDSLQSMIEDEMTPEYRIYGNGEIYILPDTGEPEMIPKGGFILYEGTESVYYYYMTQEQVDSIMEIIDALDFTPESSLKTVVMNIIREELDPWLYGDKTLEKAADNIQNRVQILVQENM